MLKNDKSPKMNVFSFSPNCVVAMLLVLLMAACSETSSAQSSAANVSSVCLLDRPINYRLQPFIQVLADSNAAYAIEDIVQPRLQALFQPFMDKKS